MSQNFVLDGLFGFTRQHTFQLPGGPAKCWGDVVGIPNACQPPLQRDYALPRIDFITGTWSSYGNGIRTNDNTGSVFDYLDPQWQYVANAGWNKGTHNVKFGADVHRPVATTSQPDRQHVSLCLQPRIANLVGGDPVVMRVLAGDETSALQEPARPDDPAADRVEQDELRDPLLQQSTPA